MFRFSCALMAAALFCLLCPVNAEVKLIAKGALKERQVGPMLTCLAWKEAGECVLQPVGGLGSGLEHVR